MDTGLPGNPTAASSSGGQKRKGETPTGGVWYRFYGKLSVCQIGPQSDRAVLKFHRALYLLHHGPVCQGVQVPGRRPTVNLVLLLGAVQEQGMADAVPHHGEGPVWALPARRRPACSQPVCLTPDCPIANIFVRTDNIGGQGRARRREVRRGQTQVPEGRRRWG